jgi:hypothetical protein
LVQNLLPSPLLSKNVKMRIYKTNNLAHGSVWERNLVSDIKEHRLWVFENRLLRIFGLKRDVIRVVKTT